MRKKLALMLAAALVICSALVATALSASENTGKATLAKPLGNFTPPTDPPSLNGTDFSTDGNGQTKSAVLDCTNNGGGKWSFEVKGHVDPRFGFDTSTAWTGKYDEKGSFTIDPGSPAAGIIVGGYSKLENFKATFEVQAYYWDSNQQRNVWAFMEGRKSESDEFTGPYDSVFGGPNDEAQRYANDCIHNSQNLYADGDFDNANYTVQIDTLDGDWTDSGKSQGTAYTPDGISVSDYQAFKSDNGASAVPGT